MPDFGSRYWRGSPQCKCQSGRKLICKFNLVEGVAVGDLYVGKSGWCVGESSGVRLAGS